MTKIDIVIPWVNGEDPRWLKKKNSYLHNVGEKPKNPEKDNRFRDYGTLKYVFRSIAKYAPWVNHIYLVTDDQVPDWLDFKNKKISLIDHRDIIPDKYLPVFNSDVIDFAIPNIKGLSEHYVLFNDDTMLNKSVKPEDFFVNDLPRDSRTYKGITPTESFDHILLNDMILINNWLSNRWPLNKKGILNTKNGKWLLTNIFQLIKAELLHKRNLSGYFNPHVPLSFNKSSFDKANEIWAGALSKNNENRFRSTKDISVWIIRYLQLETGNFVPRSISFGKNYIFSQVDQFINDLKKQEHYLVCINDADSDVDNYGELAEKIDKGLSIKFKEKSEFEI